MYEEELLEKIRKSSEEVKIPEELKPDEIEKKLKSTKMRRFIIVRIITGR